MTQRRVFSSSRNSGFSRSIGVLAVVLLLPSFRPDLVWALRHDTTQPVVVASPDGLVRITFRIRRAPGGRAVPSYGVTYRGAVVVGDSDLGLDLAESGPFGNGARISSVTRGAHDATVTGIIGKTSEARDHYAEAIVGLVEPTPPQRRVELVFRAYDDGIAFRYRVPEQAAFTEFTINDERTQIAVDGRSLTYALPLESYTTSFEGTYAVAPLSKIPADALLALPVLLHHPSGAWIALTEADLTDYAGMYLSRPRRSAGILECRLSPWPGQPDVKVRASAPHQSPWRVVMIADRPGRLIESNLVYLLNEPSAIADTSWIRPGKTTFPWWNDYVVPDEPFKGGLNTATMKYYIDFCAANGIEYHTLDGFDDTAWYGGPIVPNGAKPDVTTSLPEIDMPEVLRYAKQKGVRIRLWMHWQALRAQIDEALARYEEWGVEGIMVDFMDRNDQEMVRFYREIVEKAAAHHLTVTMHGSYEPTGLRRTFPNLLTREGVMNLEYDKFDPSPGITPEHELIVPFTRMLAGPLDFHEGGFRYSAERGFRTQYTAPVVIGTRARTLAMYVVYENYLPMVADYPAAYRGQAGLDFLVGTPTTWDETRVLDGEVGAVITVARRRGDVWYVGIMTDGSARTVNVPLRFLGGGTYVAEVYADDPKAPQAQVRHERSFVSSSDVIRAAMAPAGGYAMRLSPAPVTADGNPTTVRGSGSLARRNLAFDDSVTGGRRSEAPRSWYAGLDRGW